MKTTWSVTKQANVPSTNNAPNEFGDLPFPGVGTVGGATNAEIVRTCEALGISGASHNAGRPENLAAYVAHVQRVHREAGDLAVQRFIADATLKLADATKRLEGSQ